MAKKQFFATISMLRPDQLKELDYTAEFKKDFVFMPTSSPAIAMIEMYLNPGDDYEIITVRTDDDNERTKINYDEFKKDLKRLGAKKGMDITISKEILIPHNESREKHIKFFREMCDAYKPLSDVYMDVTYGSKVTSISLFASLVYAENATQCNIEDIIYGKFAHNDRTGGELFSIRCLYELKELVHSASLMGNVNIDEMLDIFGGIQDGE